MSLSKLYYLIFYKVRSFVTWTNQDGWEDFRAMGLVIILQSMLFLQICIWFEVIFKASLFDFPYVKLALALFALILAYANYYATFRNDKWKKYAVEFKAYPKRNKIISGWAVFLLFIAVPASLVFAFYHMSLIDWSKYR